jgi:DME family drug/metabolite transporter
MSVYFAIQAAFFFALSHILIRRGLVGSNAIVGSLISLATTAATSWALTLWLVPLEGALGHALWYFAIAGIFAPGLGRTLAYVGIERIGVARSVPIVNASPMFASILAVLLLGEDWALQNALGTCLVVLGVVQLSRSHAEEKSWRAGDLFLPILGALAFAVSANLRKAGLEVINLPLLAAAVTSTVALLFAALVFPRLQGGWRKLPLPQRSLRWFLAAGMANSAATISVFYALGSGKVVVVEPLVSTNPVLSLILSAIFLKDLEAITSRVVMGALCTVAGTILIVTA